MRFLQFTALAIGLLVVRSACAEAQGSWLDGGGYAAHAMYYAPPWAAVYESWPVEAYYPPIAPVPWYGSMTVKEQARMLAARRAADAQRERGSATERPTAQGPVPAEGAARSPAPAGPTANDHR